MRNALARMSQTLPANFGIGIATAPEMTTITQRTSPTLTLPSVLTAVGHSTVAYLQYSMLLKYQYWLVQQT